MKTLTMDYLKRRTIEEGECMIWKGYALEGVYPQMSLDGKSGHVRPIVYRALVGEIPDGHFISTTCKTPLCVNPACLIHQMRGKACKGVKKSKISIAKVAKFKQNSSCVLDWEKIEKIRASTESHQAEAMKYGVHRTHISRIRANETWVQRVTPFTGLGAR